MDYNSLLSSVSQVLSRLSTRIMMCTVFISVLKSRYIVII